MNIVSTSIKNSFEVSYYFCIFKSEEAENENEEYDYGYGGYPDYGHMYKNYEGGKEVPNGKDKNDRKDETGLFLFCLF